ncbi:MAG: alpha/beta hydrolase-fold protein [Planctomycetota bacterium]|nr:alpha/beta hydrolase-fold protein [Planctomycetota bacterium]
MKRKQIALVVWLALPVLVVALLCYAIAVSLDSRDEQRDLFPPKGAGAGDTGGVNAAGELLAGNPANHGTREGREADAAAPASEPDLVHPETLPQGFVLIVEDVSKRATESSPVFLAGTMNAWNPGDAKWKLQAQSDGRWRIVVPALADQKPIEFKFTRGSWALEELTEGLTPPANRTLPKIDASKLAPGERPTFDFRVPAWGDQKPGAAASAPEEPVRVKGTVRRLPLAGGVASGTRELLVWLPPGYDDPRNAAVKYPVLYLHDGQNLFEKPASAPDEWHADETADELIRLGRMRPVIIVGVPHAGAQRVSEYLPVAALDAGTPARGDEHVEWLVREVLPLVERTFRVKPGADETGIGGSSLGAVIALHAASKHPDRFGLVLAESPSLVLGAPGVMRAWAESVAPPRRVFLGVGTAETGDAPASADRNRAYVQAVEDLDARFKRAGLGPDRRLLIVAPGATHTESAWAARLPMALSFLFPPPLDSTK